MNKVLNQYIVKDLINLLIIFINHAYTSPISHHYRNKAHLRISLHLDNNS